MNRFLLYNKLHNNNNNNNNKEKKINKIKNKINI